MGGWDQLRARLVGDKEGRAMIVTFSTCADSIRAVPFYNSLVGMKRGQIL
jgi:hypothetical protein